MIFQGVLGGMRVLLDERTLAMLHGCTGPLFFALDGGDGRRSRRDAGRRCDCAAERSERRLMSAGWPS